MVSTIKHVGAHPMPVPDYLVPTCADASQVDAASGDQLDVLASCLSIQPLGLLPICFALMTCSFIT
eukprot:6000118-Karenia_brevis.AAC.1